MADTSSYQESQSGTLDWYNKAVQDLLAKGQTQSNQALKQYTGNQVAGFNPQQTQAFNLAGSNVGNWKPALTSATAGVNKAITTGQQAQGAVPGAINAYNAASAGVAGLGGAGTGALTAFQNAQNAGTYDQSQVQNYLNPYLGGVIDEIARLGNKNFTNVLNPAVANQFGGLGQYGSARQALAIGQAAGDTQKAISGQQASTLKDAYDSAMQGYYNFSNLGANTGISAGQGLGNLAQLQANTNTSVGQGLSGLGEWGTSAGIQGAQRLTDIGNATQQAGIADYGTLFNAGQAQQQLEQNKLNVAKAQFDEKQQYPWQQLGNYQQLFGVTTPQQSSSWSTTLKKGGLVRYAEGGRFPRGEEPDDWPELNDRYGAGQLERESLRRLMLERELAVDPEDPYSEAIRRELSGMGGIEPGIAAEDAVPNILSEANNFSRQVLGQKIDPSAMRRKLVERMLGNRESLGKRIQETLAPVEEPPTLQKLGRAMMASAAQGPANYGQLIGRAGDAYFGSEENRAAMNKELELKRLELEERATPDVGKVGLSGALGGVEHFKFMRGKDGSLWGVSDVDPTHKVLVQPGDYLREVNVAAASAADKDLENATFDTVEGRSAARQRLIDHYTNLFAARYAGGMAPVEDQGPAAGGRQPAMQPPFSSSPPAIGRPPEPQAGVSGPEARPIPGTILNPQETKEGEGVGTSLAKQYSGILESATNAQGELHNYERLEQLLDGVQTGKLTPVGTEAAAWMHAAFPSWEIDPTLPNKEAFAALSAGMALELRNPSGGAGMPGAMSDKDREFLTKMVPNLSNTPDGIKLMIQTRKKLAERSIHVAKMAREYRQKNPRGNFNEGFYDYLSKWSQENPLFSEAEAPPSSKRNEEKPTLKKGDVVRGYEFMGGENVIENWRKVE